MYLLINLGIADCRITRCGYTGEDGFEISVVPEHAVQLARYLFLGSNAYQSSNYHTNSNISDFSELVVIMICLIV
jgi:Aminomethyltransferase folate-binding domain